MRTTIDGHELADDGTVTDGAHAPGDRQIQAFYLMECEDLDAALAWANRLPTYGVVEVRELIDY